MGGNGPLIFFCCSMSVFGSTHRCYHICTYKNSLVCQPFLEIQVLLFTVSLSSHFQFSLAFLFTCTHTCDIPATFLSNDGHFSLYFVTIAYSVAVNRMHITSCREWRAEVVLQMHIQGASHNVNQGFKKYSAAQLIKPTMYHFLPCRARHNILKILHNFAEINYAKHFHFKIKCTTLGCRVGSATANPVFCSNIPSLWGFFLELKRNI